ncbi:unc-112-related protein-like, partial [Diaphorina citri]|uniref:Unc-112-related protein-like n=1 Tax=Diaphorina citri TaxID=121845 RepID=A0A3Q0JIE7_DIACI
MCVLYVYVYFYSYPPFICAPITPMKHSASTPISSPLNNNNGTWHKKSYSEMNGSYSPVSWNGNVSTLEMLNGSLDSSLACSPSSPCKEARAKLVKPKSLVEKARLNVAWLDSSLSIYEQGVKEFDTLRLRFKFYSIYDLNAKTDAVRINQLYEQAKCPLYQSTFCSPKISLFFFRPQVQVNLQSNVAQPTDTSSISLADDDIDAALTDLQVTLEGSHISLASPDIMHVPELYDYLRCLKPKRFTMKAYKRLWVTCRELQLRFYKSREDAQHSSPINEFSLRGCEVTPDVNLSQGKFIIKLEVPAADGMSEMFLRCENEEQYASWMAACRLQLTENAWNVNWEIKHMMLQLTDGNFI